MSDYAAHYAAWHDDSDAHRAEMADWYRRLLAPLLRGLPSDARVLDVGCGTGLLVGALLGMGFTHVQGVDISPGQIAVAARRGLPCRLIAPEGAHEGAHEGLAALAHEQPATFEMIFLMDVLEHIAVTEQIGFLRCARALLVPGGRLVISVPNAGASFAAHWHWNDPEHTSSFSPQRLSFVLGQAGLGSMELHPCEFGRRLRAPYLHQAAFWRAGLRRAFRALRRLEAVAEFGRQGQQMPLSLNLLAMCRKPAQPAAAGDDAP